MISNEISSLLFVKSQTSAAELHRLALRQRSHLRGADDLVGIQGDVGIRGLRLDDLGIGRAAGDVLICESLTCST